jgi:hypothetical protein
MIFIFQVHYDFRRGCYSSRFIVAFMFGGESTCSSCSCYAFPTAFKWHVETRLKSSKQNTVAYLYGAGKMRVYKHP